jgi:tetratricopeptide (TPR) repeat protein
MRKIKFIPVAFLASIIFLASTLHAQQLKVPAASPLQTIKQAFGLSDITIEYSRPGVKGRIIYGDLVPWGKIWRTGANAATKITFGDTVNVEGKQVPAGTYALYTIPNKESWEILLYKDPTLGSVADYKIENELLRFTIKPTALQEKVETFTINVADVTPSSANIELFWDHTRASFNVVADIDAKIMKSIESTVVMDSRPYFSAANYYYENDKDLKQALEWANKAIDQNPKGFFIVHLKAKIQKKLKDYQGALTSAEQSMALAREAKSNDYVALNEKLIAELKRSK